MVGIEELAKDFSIDDFKDSPQLMLSTLRDCAIDTREVSIVESCIRFSKEQFFDAITTDDPIEMDSIVVSLSAGTFFSEDKIRDVISMLREAFYQNESSIVDEVKESTVIVDDVEFSSLPDYSTCCQVVKYHGDRKEVKLPESVLFDGKSKILIAIGPNSFEKTVVESLIMPDSIVDIGSCAFHESELSRIHLSSSLEHIDYSAFSGCKSLEEINLPSSLNRMGPHAFNRTGIKSISIPEGIIKIDDSLFSFCRSLIEVILPKTVKEIGDGAFMSTGLKSINLNEGLERIGYEAF